MVRREMGEYGWRKGRVGGRDEKRGDGMGGTAGRFTFSEFVVLVATSSPSHLCVCTLSLSLRRVSPIRQSIAPFILRIAQVSVRIGRPWCLWELI